MALAPSACLMTHPASYSGKGSSLGPLFGNPAACLTQGDLLPPITCKDRVRLQGLVFGESEGRRLPWNVFPKEPWQWEGRATICFPGLGSLQALSLVVPKKHRGVDQCHSTRMNMVASS